MKVFVVTLYRMCQRDAESYPLGAFTSKELAAETGRCECHGRDYKYGYEISELELDHYDPDDDAPLDEIICAHGKPNGRMID